VCGRWQTSSAYLRRFVPIAAAGAEGATAILQGARERGGRPRPPSLPHREHRSTSTLTLNVSDGGLNLSPIQVAVAALRIRVHVALQPRRQVHSGRGKVATTRARHGMHRRAGPTGGRRGRERPTRRAPSPSKTASRHSVGPSMCPGHTYSDKWFWPWLALWGHR
jgi:hypothetical protein